MHTVVFALLASCLGILPVMAPSSGFQQGRRGAPAVPTTPSPAQLPTTDIRDDGAGDTPLLSERGRAAKGNPEQLAQAVADARRLAQLSRELQQELEQAGDGTLPAPLFRKADEIIKLAKSVKGRMRPE